MHTLPLLFATLLANNSAQAANHPKLPYEDYRVGAVSDVTRATTPGTVIMGGSADLNTPFA